MLNYLRRRISPQSFFAYGAVVIGLMIPLASIAKDLACGCSWSSGGSTYSSEYAVQGGNCCTGGTFGSGYYTTTNSGGSTGSYCSASDAQMACCQ